MFILEKLKSIIAVIIYHYFGVKHEFFKSFKAGRNNH